MTTEQMARALDLAAQIDCHDWPRSLLCVSTLSLLAEALIAADRERDHLRGELRLVDAALARRPALDRPTRAANIEHACNTTQRETDRAHALEADNARLRAALERITLYGRTGASTMTLTDEQVRALGFARDHAAAVLQTDAIAAELEDLQVAYNREIRARIEAENTVSRLRAALEALPAKAIHTVTLCNLEGVRREEPALLVSTLHAEIAAVLCDKETPS